MTGALAIACFVKVYGVVFLGTPRTQQIEQAREVPFGMQLSQAILAFCCLAFGVLPTWTTATLNVIPQRFLGVGMPGADVNNWAWLTPINNETASYGAPAVLIGLLLSWAIVYIFLHPRKKEMPTRISHTWDCGFGPLSPRMQYTTVSFAQPIRRIFSFAWKITQHVEPARDVKGPIYHLHVNDWVWMKVYQPISTLIHLLAEKISRIQGGDLRVYLSYSFFTLLFLLWVIV
jgi:hydrogenase-4 component B